MGPASSCKLGVFICQQRWPDEWWLRSSLMKMIRWSLQGPTCIFSFTRGHLYKQWNVACYINKWNTTWFLKKKTKLDALVFFFSFFSASIFPYWSVYNNFKRSKFLKYMYNLFKTSDLFGIFWNNLKCLKHSEMIEEHFQEVKKNLISWNIFRCSKHSEVGNELFGMLVGTFH